MSKKNITILFIVMIIVALGAGLYLYQINKVEPLPENNNPIPELKSRDQILLELNSFPAPENVKSEKEIIKELNSFKTPTKVKSREEILNELNGASTSN